MVADQINRNDGTQDPGDPVQGRVADVGRRGLGPAARGDRQLPGLQHGVDARRRAPSASPASYRSPKLPDVPTLVEQGVDGALVTLEGGLPLMARGRHARAGAASAGRRGRDRRRSARRGRAARELRHPEQAAEPGRHKGTFRARSAGVGEAGGGPGRQARLSQRKLGATAGRHKRRQKAPAAPDSA